MVICEIVTGPTRIPLVCAYLLVSTLEHLSDVKEILKRFKVWYPVVLVDLNVDQDNERNPWSQSVEDLFTKYGLIDLV